MARLRLAILLPRNSVNHISELVAVSTEMMDAGPALGVGTGKSVSACVSRSMRPILFPSNSVNQILPP